MTMQNEKEPLGRRDFIKKAGLTVGAAGVVTVAVASPVKAGELMDSQTVSGGYQETDHVRTYYKLAAF